LKEDFTMRAKLIIAGLMMAAALPAVASAQPYDQGCVQSNQDNHVAGTVLGAIGGAVIGGAVAGRHDRGAGVVIGGVGGALAGNAISHSADHPCPSGYYYAPPPGAEGYGPPPPGADGRFWDGAPQGIRERIDFMQDRVNRASSNGWISGGEGDRANRELNFIRSETGRLRDQDGGHLRPEDRDYLQGRLDSLSQRLHWAEHNS
jgi:hypothetical protein